MIDLFDHVYNCAHRGASGRAPENTRSALTLAVRLGADMAEIDVQEAADGQLVVFHDERLDRTTDGRGLLAARTWSELCALDAGSWFNSDYAGERILTLAEAMDLVRGSLALNIELKAAGPSSRYLDRVIRTIQEHDFVDRCVVTSFNRELIAEAAAAQPGFALGHIIGRGELPEGEFNARVDLLSLEKSLVTASVLEFAAAAGKAVHAWTVNDTADMTRLVAQGVDGVITNYPGLFTNPARTVPGA